MKYLVIVSFLIIASCKKEVKQQTIAEVEVNNVDAINDLEIEVYDYDGLKPFLNKTDDKVYVVNFWATWCAPCVKELPYFEKLNQNYKNKNVNVLLVSLDFPSQYDKKLKPFIVKKNIQSKVIAFDDTNQDRWIPAISENWSGALPATLIYAIDKRNFYERSFNYDELETELNKFLK